MALPFKIKKLEDVAEAFRSLYVKTADGSYELEVEGAVSNDKLKEFREKNIELLKEAEKFKDLNPEKYAQLLELQRQREEKELIDKGELDKVVEGRVTAMKKEYDATKDTLESSLTIANRQLETLMIDNTLRDHAAKNGVRPEAVDDVLLRGKSVFSVKDGKVVSLDKEGKVVYGVDGTTPLGIDEWSKGLKTAAPHLYLGSAGGGSGNGAGGGQGGAGAGGKVTAISKISAGLASGNLG